jgi:FMN phosphatase YigB (HAD superfamily)
VVVGPTAARCVPIPSGGAEGGSAEPDLSADQIAGLREHLDQVWQHAHTIDPGSERDLSQDRHWDVFSRTVALYPGVKPDLIAALYAVMPDQWVPFDDTLPVLQEPKSRGVRIVVLSNIGLDIRPLLDRVGVSGLLDGVVLSFEVGLVKPDRPSTPTRWNCSAFRAAKP